MHHGRTQLTGEIGVLAEGFLAAAPAGIAEDIDVRRPEGEALVLAAATGREGGVVLGARFVGDRIGDATDEVAVPRGAETDHLRKYRGAAVATDAVAGFIPPIIGGHPESFDGRAVVQAAG